MTNAGTQPRESTPAAIVIGASAGGLEALGKILPALPATFPVPVVVVQHLRRDAGDMLIRHFRPSCSLEVLEAEDKEAPDAGRIYFVPANYHLMIDLDGTFALSVDPPKSFSRPSIDLLFETAAEAWEARLVGVLLTGANTDGAWGLKRIKDLGGKVIVQDPATAEAQAMPAAALRFLKPDFVGDPAQIAQELLRSATDRAATFGGNHGE